MKNLHLIKVFLRFVIIEENEKCPPWTLQATKMTTIIKIKQFIMIMQ